MKTRTVLLVAILFVISILMPLSVFALDSIEPLQKTWEVTVSGGLKNYSSSSLASGAYAEVRAQMRVKYPVLIGVGVEGSIQNDVFNVSAGLPVSLRFGANAPAKLDFVVFPAVVYASNTETDVTKIFGACTVGFEVKKFIKQGIYIGAGAYYTFNSMDEFNNTRGGILIGF